MQDTGDLLHVPAAAEEAAARATDAAVAAFAALAGCDDEQITEFFDRFAARLDDDDVVAPIVAANEADVAKAAAAGRSTTRLVLSPRMRDDMIAGLRGWRDSPLRRDDVLGRIEHEGWAVEARRAPLGVVGFVFEGRPNVFADATGVAAHRQHGRDADRVRRPRHRRGDPRPRARARPSPTPGSRRARSAWCGRRAGRRDGRCSPTGACPSPSPAAPARRSPNSARSPVRPGRPVSLHGTGGAWLVAAPDADAERFRAAVVNSLDRKVCNTLNVCCVPATRPDLVGVFLDALDEAAAAEGDGGPPPRRGVVPRRRAGGALRHRGEDPPRRR